MTADYIGKISDEFEFSMAEQSTEGEVEKDKSERFFDAAIEEMTHYLFERFRDLDGWVGDYLTPENVENIYLSHYYHEPSLLVVEMDDLPDDFRLENANIREFYWHPDPGLSGETTAAYFQPRLAF